MCPANGSATVLKMKAAGLPRPLRPRAASSRAKDALDEQVEEAGRAEVLRGHAARDRKEIARDDRVLEGGRESSSPVTPPPLEVALHQSLVRLDDRVHELLAVLGGLHGHLVGDVDRARSRARRSDPCRRACGRDRRCPSARARARSGSGRRRTGRRASSGAARKVVEKSARSLSNIVTKRRRQRPSASARSHRRVVCTSIPVDAVDGEERSTTRSEASVSAWKPGSRRRG